MGIGIFAILCAFLLAAFPAVSMDGAKEALYLCANILIPSLFPFFVVTNLLMQSGITERISRKAEPFTKHVFGIGGDGAIVILMGLLSGYPAGAAATCTMYQQDRITRQEAMRLLAFTNNAGPLFIIGTIGTGIYHHSQIGYILFFSSLLSALMTGFCFRFMKAVPIRLLKKKGSEKGKEPIEKALETMLLLCGYVILFSVILAFLEKFGFVKRAADILVAFGVSQNTADFFVRGLCEISSAAAKGGTPSVPIMAMILSFGGLSVFMQTAGIVRRAGLSVKTYCIGKMLAGVFSFAISKILLLCFPVTMDVFSHTEPYTPVSNNLSFRLLLTWFAAFLIKRICAHFLKSTRKTASHFSKGKNIYINTGQKGKNMVK